MAGAVGRFDVGDGGLEVVVVGTRLLEEAKEGIWSEAEGLAVLKRGVIGSGFWIWGGDWEFVLGCGRGFVMGCGRGFCWGLSGPRFVGCVEGLAGLYRKGGAAERLLGGQKLIGSV